MAKTFILIPQNCTGCRTCELACSMGKAVDGRLAHSRISIFKTGHEQYMQMTCLQCVDAACVKVCPTNALVRDSESRYIKVDEDRCIGCGLCETACPFGHMFFDKSDGKPKKCDMCGGDPVCARFCPHGALETK